jgi:hypothetical protein
MPWLQKLLAAGTKMKKKKRILREEETLLY